LTAMVSPHSQFVRQPHTPRWAGRAARSALAAASGGAAAGAVAAVVQDEMGERRATERAEAHPAAEPSMSRRPVPALEPAVDRQGPATESPTPPPPSSPSPGRSTDAGDVGRHTDPGAPKPWLPDLEAAAPEEFEGEEVFVI